MAEGVGRYEAASGLGIAAGCADALGALMPVEWATGNGTMST